MGQTAAAQILAVRAADRAYELPVIDTNYPQAKAPGEYRFTPPFTFAFETKWGGVPPFVLRSSDSFEPGAPYPVNSRRYRDDYSESKDWVMTEWSRGACALLTRHRLLCSGWNPLSLAGIASLEPPPRRKD
jgi:hypothetical protein